MGRAGGLLEGLVDQTLVVSMPSHPRRVPLQRHLDEMGIRFQFFDAFQGTRMDLDALAQGGAMVPVNAYRRERHLPGEVGCYFSHVAAMLHALGRGWSRVLICEDDVEFRYAPQMVRAALEAAPADADMLYLFSTTQPGCGERQDPQRKPVNSYWREASHEGDGAVSYIASARCLSYLLRHAFPMRYTLDGLTKWPSSDWSGVELSCYIADPLLCGCAQSPSTIR